MFKNEARRERRLRRRLFTAIARDLPHPRFSVKDQGGLRVHNLQMSIDEDGTTVIMVELRYPRKSDSVIYTAQKFLYDNPHLIANVKHIYPRPPVAGVHAYCGRAWTQEEADRILTIPDHELKWCQKCIDIGEGL